MTKELKPMGSFEDAFLKAFENSKETQKQRCVREALDYPSKSGNANLRQILKDEGLLI